MNEPIPIRRSEQPAEAFVGPLALHARLLEEAAPLLRVVLKQRDVADAVGVKDTKTVREWSDKLEAAGCLATHRAPQNAGTLYRLLESDISVVRIALLRIPDVEASDQLATPEPFPISPRSEAANVRAIHSTTTAAPASGLPNSPVPYPDPASRSIPDVQELQQFVQANAEKRLEMMGLGGIKSEVDARFSRLPEADQLYVVSAWLSYEPSKRPKAPEFIPGVIARMEANRNRLTMPFRADDEDAYEPAQHVPLYGPPVAPRERTQPAYVKAARNQCPLRRGLRFVARKAFERVDGWLGGGR